MLPWSLGADMIMVVKPTLFSCSFPPHLAHPRPALTPFCYRHIPSHASWIAEGELHYLESASIAPANAVGF